MTLKNFLSKSLFSWIHPRSGPFSLSLCLYLLLSFSHSVLFSLSLSLSLSLFSSLSLFPIHLSLFLPLIGCLKYSTRVNLIKHFTIIIYDSRFVLTRKMPILQP